jgi:hypothetical protein
MTRFCSCSSPSISASSVGYFCLRAAYSSNTRSPCTDSVLAYRRARPLLRRAHAVFPRSVSLDFVADSFTNGSALPHPGHRGFDARELPAARHDGVGAV